MEDGIQLGEELIFRNGEPLEKYLVRTDWYRTRKYPMPACNFLDLDGNWEGEAAFGWNSCSQDWEDALTLSCPAFHRKMCWWLWIVISKFIFIILFVVWSVYVL